MEKKQVPAIRFQGFTDAWEQRKVGDFLTISKIPGHTGVDAKKLTVKLWGKGITEKTDIFGGSENTQYYVRHTGQFMYGKLDFLHAAFGIVPKNLDNYESTLDSPAFDLHGIDGQFLLERVTQENFYLHNGMIANGSRKAKRIHEDIFLNMDLRVPTFDEQKKIGDYFKQLDHLITLHQRKYEKLLKVKKSMLEKMFPRDGADVPEIRFDGFTDAWEQRKLGELIREISTGKSVNSDEGIVGADNIGVLKTSCVSYDHFDPSESKPVVKDERHLVKCAVEEDSVIVSRMNTPERVGACGYVERSFSNLFLPDRLWKLKFQENVNTYFLYTMLVSGGYKEKITSMASGTSGSMYNIPKDAFLNLRLTLSLDIDEQKKIGDYFKQLDHLITLHQRKLEKLKNIKKSLLEKMFV